MIDSVIGKILTVALQGALVVGIGVGTATGTNLVTDGAVDRLLSEIAPTAALDLPGGAEPLSDESDGSDEEEGLESAPSAPATIRAADDDSDDADDDDSDDADDDDSDDADDDDSDDADDD